MVIRSYRAAATVAAHALTHMNDAAVDGSYDLPFAYFGAGRRGNGREGGFSAVRLVAEV